MPVYKACYGAQAFILYISIIEVKTMKQFNCRNRAEATFL